MPIRDDLILRMLDQIGAVVAAVLTGRAPDDLAQAERELASAYVELTGSGRELVGRLSSEQLLAILGAPASFNRERGYVLARLLEADARLGEAEAGGGDGSTGGGRTAEGGTSGGRTGEGGGGLTTGPASDAAAALANGRRLKALDLYLEAARAGLDEEDLEERIEGLLATTSGLALPEGSHWRVFDHVVAHGRFAEAEDMLFDGVARFGADDALAARGRAFYRDLEGLSDAALEEGALPREEVVEGRDAFEAELTRARVAGEEPR